MAFGHIQARRSVVRLQYAIIGEAITIRHIFLI